MAPLLCESDNRSRPAPARKSPRSQSTAARLRQRAEALWNREIDFIDNPAFREIDPEEILGTVEASAASTSGSMADLELPAHLARLCETKLLTPKEEVELFRRMNYLKFYAEQIRSEIDTARPRAKQLQLAEICLSRAETIRDRIIQANMRLVMSIVKKFVTPQNSFDDLLSDGTMTLMQAVDKFDYDRGFRFSTYAYRAIARNAYRAVTDRQKEVGRFGSLGTESMLEVEDQGDSSSMNEQTWSTLRNLLPTMLDNLDRRERFIIRGRYALGAHRKVRTFQCLADKLGVSKERVRQLEQRAVAKLQAMAEETDVDELIAAALC